MAEAVETPKKVEQNDFPDTKFAPAAPDGFRKVSLPPEVIHLRQARKLIAKRARSPRTSTALDNINCALQVLAAEDGKRGSGMYDQAVPIEKDQR